MGEVNAFGVDSETQSWWGHVNSVGTGFSIEVPAGLTRLAEPPRSGGVYMHRLLNGVFLVLLSVSLGLHWVALQGVAWTAMLVERVPTSGWVRALETTFDGKHPCRLCHEVRVGYAESQETEVTASEGRFELIPPVVLPLTLLSPQTPGFVVRPGSEWIVRFLDPDVPPPRRFGTIG